MVGHSCCCLLSPVNSDSRKKKSQTIKLSTPSHSRVKFNFYFDWSQPLFCLNGMQRDISSHPSCQVGFDSILSVFPEGAILDLLFDFFFLVVKMEARETGFRYKITTSLQSCSSQ